MTVLREVSRLSAFARLLASGMQPKHAAAFARLDEPAYDAELDDADGSRCEVCGIAPLGGPYDDATRCGTCAREIADMEREERRRHG